MREIKFRAWDKERKLMSNPFTIGDWGTVNIWWPNSDIVSTLDDVELLEYTGLKDKNGEEIYEGDWLTLRNKRRVYQVSYEANWGGYTANGKECAAISPSLWKEAEVMGNVYENPELLEASK